MPSFRSLMMVRSLALLTLFIFAIQMMVVFVIWREQAQRSETFILPLPAKIAAIVDLVDGAPPEQRQLLLRALDTGDFQVRIERQRPENEARESISLTAFKQAVAQYSAELKGRPIDGMVGGIQSRFRDPVQTKDGLSANFPMRLNIQLNSGEWLVIETPSLADARFRRMPVGVFAGLFGLVIASLALITIWQQFRPVRDMAESARKFAGEGKPLLVRPGGSRDIRELVSAFNNLQEQVSTLLSNRTLMMSAMSHDVRTYLTRLRLRIEDLEPDSREAAEKTINEIQALLEDTLAFAEAEGCSADHEPVYLAQLFSDLMTSGQFGGDKVTLDVRERALVSGHAGRLQRAFVNLIANAVKFGSAASVTVGTDGQQALITVADRGPGIPAEERELVFQPFYRRDFSRRRSIEGAGLGLAIAKSIIAQHGGQIRLSERPGGGLIVTVLLPLAT